MLSLPCPLQIFLPALTTWWMFLLPAEKSSMQSTCLVLQTMRLYRILLKFTTTWQLCRFLPQDLLQLQFFCSQNSTQGLSTQKLYHLYQSLNREFYVTSSSLLVYTQGNPNIVSNKEKGRISKRVLQENKLRQIFWKWTCVCVSGGLKCLFSRKCGVLVTSVLRFSLLSYHRRYLRSALK